MSAYARAIFLIFHILYGSEHAVKIYSCIFESNEEFKRNAKKMYLVIIFKSLARFCGPEST